MSPTGAPMVLPLDWASRRVQPALSAERLSVLLEATALRSGELLFTSAAGVAARWGCAVAASGGLGVVR